MDTSKAIRNISQNLYPAGAKIYTFVTDEIQRLNIFLYISRYFLKFLSNFEVFTEKELAVYNSEQSHNFLYQQKPRRKEKIESVGMHMQTQRILLGKY